MSFYAVKHSDSNVVNLLQQFLLPPQAPLQKQLAKFIRKYVLLYDSSSLIHRLKWWKNSSGDLVDIVHKWGAARNIDVIRLVFWLFELDSCLVSFLVMFFCILGFLVFCVHLKPYCVSCFTQVLLWLIFCVPSTHLPTVTEEFSFSSCHTLTCFRQVFVFDGVSSNPVSVGEPSMSVFSESPWSFYFNFLSFACDHAFLLLQLFVLCLIN